MKPPSKDAISKALDILLESVQEENGYTFPTSRTIPLNDIPFEELATHADVLNSAKSYLAKEADALISRIQLRRNGAAPFHRLPEEIFETILEMTETGEPAADIRDLLLLCQVGRLWHATIFNSPRLWTRMDTKLSPKMARLVLDLSKGLPLSLLWKTVYKGGRCDPILDLAVQHSSRFRSMDLRVYLRDSFDIKRLLESPNSALESLTAEVSWASSDYGDWTAATEVTLSEGAPLKHLTLKTFTLDLHSHQLSKLVTLSLEGSAVPASLETLLQILSRSTQLEQLTISNNRQPNEVPQPSPLVTLPRIKSLKIDRITIDYGMALLASIYTPACCRIHLSDSGWVQKVPSLDALVWQPGSLQAAALLGFTSGSEFESGVLEMSTTLFISTMATIISITHNATAVCGKKKDGHGSRLLSFSRLEESKIVNLIGGSLLHLLYPSGPSLALTRPLPQHDFLDLRPWSSTLESLRLLVYESSLSALEQLSQCIAVPGGTGAEATESWMCPNLRSITIHIPVDEEKYAIYIAALRSLVRKRWSGEDGDLAPAIQPDRFVIVTSNLFEDVQSEIQRIVPSFMFAERE